MNEFKFFIVTDQGQHFDPMLFSARNREELVKYLTRPSGFHGGDPDYIIQEVQLQTLVAGIVKVS